MPEDVPTIIEALIELLLVIFVVGVVAQRIRLPYTVLLVLVGLLGFQPGFHHIHLTPDLILTVLLPVLLFEGAYNVSVTGLRRTLLPITLLAVPGVFLGTAITGVIVHLVIGLAWPQALLFGALISSTDPIAVVSLFKELGVPRRLSLIVEGESLFNDGAAITLFQILLAGLLTGSFNIGAGILQFLLTVAGALVIGVVIGYGGSFLLRIVDSPQIQIMVTLIAAYGSYLVAEHFNVSGAIAVVLTALFFGNYGSTRGLNPRGVYAISVNWEFLGFIANSLIFLLIGIEMDPLTLLRSWWYILIAFLATLVARAFVVYLLPPWLRGKQRVPHSYRPVMLWGGLRGAVSLALVLSLPFTLHNTQVFPDRNLLQVMTFGVVAASLVLQGVTMRPLIRWLGLAEEKDPQAQAESARARLLAVEGAMLMLSRAHDRSDISNLEYERLSRSYQVEHDQLEEQMRHFEELAADAEEDDANDAGDTSDAGRTDKPQEASGQAT